MPETTPEIALATIARFAQDRADPKLTAIAADLASAYGRGPVALLGPVAVLNQYAYDNYHWGDRALSLQLMRPVVALDKAAGFDSLKHLDARPPDQRSRPTEPAPAATQKPAREPTSAAAPQTIARDPGTDEAVARIVASRQANQRDMDTFYADPNYQRQRAGAPDEALDEEYLLRRRRLFGKALQ